MPRSLRSSSPPPDPRGVPALVLGEGITALGALRSLGREGIQAYYAAPTRDVASFSRYVIPLDAKLAPYASRGELEAFLTALPFERMVLIPCSDWWVRSLAELPPSLRERFPTSIASREVLEILANKAAYADFSRAHDLPHPATVTIDGVDDLLALPDSAFASAFLKPRDSQSFSDHFGVKALAVRTRQEAIVAFARITAANHKVILQEYVPGPASGHFYVDAFVDREGRTLARFARQRLRMHTAFANSSALWTIPLEEAREAPELIDRAIAALRPRGIVSAEMKLDPRDGRLKIIEINARVWKHVDLASQCGVNICRLAYEDALGVRSDPIVNYAEHVRCVDVHRDLPHCLKLYRRHELTLPEWARTWWRAREPVLSVEDPVPGVVHVGTILGGALRRRIARRGTSGES